LIRRSPFPERAVDKTVQTQNDLVKSTPQLDNAVSNSKANGLPPNAIGPGQGAYLSILCQLMKAKSVLEIGTLGGYSTIWFATSVPGIKVTSIEFNPKHQDVAVENTKGLDSVEIILGTALDVLPKLAENSEVLDFIFIDADWGTVSVLRLGCQVVKARKLYLRRQRSAAIDRE